MKKRVLNITLQNPKNFFKRFKRNKKREQKLLTSDQNVSESKWREELIKNNQINQPLNFQRDDGSTLSVIPRILQNGEQECNLNIIKNKYHKKGGTKDGD